jgi:uncharacterized protein
MSQPDEDAETARAHSLAHGQVCYLQLPATDGTRAAAFYRDVFGWDIEAHSPDFEAPGLIGQFVEGRPPARDAGPLLWLSVADMGHALEAVTAHGGQILEPPVPDGPVRTLATIVDPEGNPIGLAGHTQSALRLLSAPGGIPAGKIRRHPWLQCNPVIMKG